MWPKELCSKHFIFFFLECYITKVCKGLLGTNTTAYRAHLYIIKKIKCWNVAKELYSQHFIFFFLECYIPLVWKGLLGTNTGVQLKGPICTL